MARKRLRLRRTLLILVLLALLLLLFELNRFLPGTWPGGGNWGGFKDRPVSAPQPLSQPTDEVAGIRSRIPDLLRGREGRMVLVRNAKGEAAKDWRIGYGTRGAQNVTPLQAGAAPLDAGQLAKGVRLRQGNGQLKHSAPAKDDGRAMVMVLPEQTLPQPLKPQPITLELKPDPITLEMEQRGQAGSRGDVRIRGMALPIQQGRVALPGPAATEPLPAEFLDLAAHAGPPDAWRTPPRPPTEGPRVSDLAPMPIALPYEPLAELAAPAGERITRLHLPGGRVLGAPKDGAPVLVPLFRRAGWHAEVRTSLSNGAERARLVPLAELEATGASPQGRKRLALPTAWPAARTVAVASAADAGVGRPGDEVVVRYRLKPAADGEPVEIVHRMPFEGRSLDLEVPVGVPVDVVLVRRDSPPEHRRVAAGTGRAMLKLGASPGVEVPVRVLDDRGQPIAMARVHATFALADMTWTWPHPERAVPCDNRGEARLGPLPKGAAQVFASAAGYAHGRSALVQVESGMPAIEIRLTPGGTLHLVVEDPFGNPIPGVRLESIEADDGGAPLVVPQVGAEAIQVDERRWRWHGLPLRPLRLQLSAPGYQPSVIRRIEPGAVTWYLTLVRDS